jgi:tRNA (adenine37-N6)-methyltransferase
VSIELTAIGFVRTSAEDIPRHWSISDVVGTLEIKKEYVKGLLGIEVGQRIVVLFDFNRSPAFSPEFLIQTSGDSGRETGVFSTCSPIRPNPIGLSIVEVIKIDGANIDIRGLDMLDGTPILDIKPHVEVKRD